MAGTTSITWSIPPSKLALNLDSWKDRMLAAVYALAQVFAARIESYAKKNAVWTDWTVHARQGLTSRAYRTATGVVIVLYHVMHYGIWLEVANEGRFAIIMHTLRMFEGSLMAAIQKLVR